MNRFPIGRQLAVHLWIRRVRNGLLRLAKRPRITLFDEFERTDRSAKRHAEGQFDFLNRVDSRFFGRVRDLLERWFLVYPWGAQQDVRARFRSGDDWQSLSAFWELYLHEAFRRVGWKVQVHPAVPESTRQPDFLIKRWRISFLVEATVVGEPLEKSKTDRRRATAMDALDRLDTPSFLLQLEWMDQGPGSPPAANVRTELKTWVDTLDAEQAEADFVSGGVSALPTYTWSKDGWTFRFRAMPKKAHLRGTVTKRALGAWGGGRAIQMDVVTPLRKVIEGKAKSYGKPMKPFVIAVLIPDIFGPEDYEESVALLGTTVGEFNGVTGQFREVRRDDGVWTSPSGPRNTRVSAVMITRRLEPWKIAQVEPTIWHNPWAEYPLPPLPWRSMNPDMSVGQLVPSDAIRRSHEIFRIPADWPGPEDLKA